MENIQFNITINASKQKVWNTMLSQDTYREWAKAFHEGSHYEGNWEKGTEMRFLGPQTDGEMGGMFSRIKENIPYEFISIEHLGMIANGEIDTESEQVKQWAPSYENYTFTENNGQTNVKIEMQTPPEYKAMFEGMWAKALDTLKTLAETN